MFSNVLCVGQSISSNLVCHSLSAFNALWWNYVTKFMERLDASENYFSEHTQFFVFLVSKLNLFWTILVLQHLYDLTL